mmetsp:Transcript_289/g.799  ORF Transcript_289/g.799 Transcript_289/m.799 type:complete len:203 (-) Transcript_289:208-816(-)
MNEEARTFCSSSKHFTAEEELGEPLRCHLARQVRASVREKEQATSYRRHRSEDGGFLLMPKALEEHRLSTAGTGREVEDECVGGLAALLVGAAKVHVRGKSSPGLCVEEVAHLHHGVPLARRHLATQTHGGLEVLLHPALAVQEVRAIVLARGRLQARRQGEAVEEALQRVEGLLGEGPVDDAAACPRVLSGAWNELRDHRA